MYSRLSKMSFMTEVQTSLDCGDTGSGSNYEYHLPHTKTIDLIGEEFAPKRAGDVLCSAPNVVVVSAVPASMGSNLIQTTTAPLSGTHLIPVSMAMSNATTLTSAEV